MFRFLRHFFLIFIFLTGKAFSNSVNDCSSSMIVANVNDNYCDCINGEDENNTSACSNRGNTRYFCSGSGILNISIPTSRVQDGICDCCDGSDEINSPFAITCPNSCPEKLLAFKRETLLEYRKLSSGLQAKNEIVNLMRRKKLREEQSYQSLLTELEETQQLFARIKIQLSIERSEENSLQFQEIRRRVRSCADKCLSVCNVFGDEYDEIEDDSLPINLFGDDEEDEEELSEDFLGEETSQTTTSRTRASKEEREKNEEEKRKEIEEEAKRKEEERSKVRKSTMTALQRVQSSYCSYLEQDTKGIIHEDSPRVHKSLQQYLSFTLGRGGKAERTRAQQVDIIRKKTTLFGPYLDNGEEGYLLGAQVICEMIGIVLSPVTVPLTLLDRQWRTLQGYFWRRIKKCSGLKKRKKSHDEGYDYDYDDYDDYEEERRSECPNWLISFSKSFKEGGSLSRLIDLFDYTQYNLLVRLSQRWLPITSRIQWYLTLIQQTPFYYFRYYLNSKDVSRLPIKRDACTLREGYRVAQEEINALKEKIENRKSNKEEDTTTATEKGGRQCQASDNVCLQKEERKVIDYSSDGSWEALHGTCLEKDDGKYVYKFCFFESSFQGSTSLGTFEGWRDDQTNDNNNNNNNDKQTEKQGRFGRFSSRKGSESILENIAKPMNTLLEQVGLSGDSERKEKEVRHKYTKQYYSGGERCFNGKVRNTMVTFHCNTTNSIDEVSEYEVCSYSMKIGTPLACSSEKEAELLERLRSLEVMGFQK